VRVGGGVEAVVSKARPEVARMSSRRGSRVPREARSGREERRVRADWRTVSLSGRWMDWARRARRRPAPMCSELRREAASSVRGVVPWPAAMRRRSSMAWKRTGRMAAVRRAARPRTRLRRGGGFRRRIGGGMG